MVHARRAAAALALTAVAVVVAAPLSAHRVAAASPALQGQAVYSLARFGDAFFAGTSSGLDVTHGAGWTNPPGALQTASVDALVTGGGALFAATPTGVFKTIDGASWSAAGLAGKSVRALDAVGTTVVAGTGTSDADGLAFRSDDGGATWQPATATAAAEGLPGARVQAVLAPRAGGTAWVGTAGGGAFFSSTANGGWSAGSTGLSDTWVASLWRSTSGPGEVLAGTDNGLDQWAGNRWAAVQLPEANAWVQAISTSASGSPLAGTYTGNVFQQSADGWTQLATGLPSVQSVLADPGGGALVGTTDGLYCPGCPGGAPSAAPNPAVSAGAGASQGGGGSVVATGAPRVSASPAAVPGAGSGSPGPGAAGGGPVANVAGNADSGASRGLLGVVAAAAVIAAGAALVGARRRARAHPPPGPAQPPP
jgi:hypothetical protein